VQLLQLLLLLTTNASRHHDAYGSSLLTASTAPEQCVMTTNISLDGVIETEPRSSSLQNYNLAASDLKVKTPDEQHKHTLMNAAPCAVSVLAGPLTSFCSS
jgi:hypothetical protein